MDELDLEEIEKACAEAMPGPWGFTYDGSSTWSLGEATDPQVMQVASVWDRDDDKAKRNLVFMAGARSWVPALVAEVKRLRERVEIWQDKEVAVASACDAHCEEAMAQEREECAKVAESMQAEYDRTHGTGVSPGDIASAIRERGKP